jgi:hypothetical protein
LRFQNQLVVPLGEVLRSCREFFFSHAALYRSSAGRMCFFEQKSLTDTSTAVKEEVGCRWKHYPAGKASRYKTGKKRRTKALSSADPLASLRAAALRSTFFIDLNRLAIAAFR